MYRSDDWKNEKHVPVIDAPGLVKKETPFNVAIAVGKEIAHPNTTCNIHGLWENSVAVKVEE
jgi:superoxide reductase